MKEKIKAIEELRAEYTNQSRVLIHELAQDLLNLDTAIRGVTWTQYTPYFNDGEPCTFGVNDPALILSNGSFVDKHKNSMYCNHSNENEGEYEFSYQADLVQELQPIIRALREFSRFLNNNSSVVQEVFGDGVKVTITRTNTKIDECPHE
jgi:hypothetical protein